jgi:F-type H+-transporting ATPase subunit c
MAAARTICRMAIRRPRPRRAGYRSAPVIIQVFFEEAWVVSKRSALTALFVLVAGAVAPLYAQTGGAPFADHADIVRWSIITAGFALGIAGGLGALGQGRAIASAVEAIARNPSASGDIRGALILGLVLIESLVIYVLAVSLILFFIKPFGG